MPSRPCELKPGFCERRAWLVLPLASLPRALLPGSLQLCSFGNRRRRCSVGDKSESGARELSAATAATLCKLAGFRLAGSESRSFPVAIRCLGTATAGEAAGARAPDSLPDAKADETTAEFTRRARALPRQQPTGTFSPFGKLGFFFKLLGSSV